jgi:ketosteroid isomerase-like protein
MMTPLRRGLACFAVATTVASACSAPQVTTSDQRASLERIRQEIESAENGGSVERMRAHFAEDVVMMAPNMPAVAGADSAAQAMRQFFDAFNVQIQYNSTEIVVSGDWAFDRGTYSQTLTPKQGGAPLKESGKYLWVYRRAGDGSWKHARVIWNTSDPLPESRA